MRGAGIAGICRCCLARSKNDNEDFLFKGAKTIPAIPSTPAFLLFFV
jgi:hypothetical protein